jgi:hypothetical protein
MRPERSTRGCKSAVGVAMSGCGGRLVDRAAGHLEKAKST